MSKPKIRFKGYEEDWEQRKLGDVTELKSASRVHKGEWTDSGVPFFRSSDVMAAINGTTNEKAYISEELYEKLSNASGKLEEGDVLVTGGGSVGNPYIVPNNEPLYTKDADLLWIKNQGRFYPYFLYEYFFSPTFRIYLSSISHVGTIAHYTITQLSETPISLPDIEEQIKVGEYFESLDRLITLHQRKCEETKKLKKYMLQKMFPQNGKRVPEIRFAGFTDDWEQRKLGEVATFINGRAYSQDELLSNGKYKVLRVGNFYTNDSWYFSDMELDEKYYANDGDLLYTWSATFGPHIWRGGKVIYHYHIWKIELSDILEKRFAVQLLEQDKAKILSDKNGSTMVHITKSGMEQKEVLLPSCVEEQAKIGAYFENLDHLITLHQRQYQKLFQ